MIEDHPITGVGAANFVTAYPHYAHGEMETMLYVTHNAYVGVAAEMGLVGLGLYLLLNLVSLGNARRAILSGRRARSPDLEILAVATEVSLISIMLEGLSGNVEGLKVLWLFFGLALSLSHLAAQDTSVRAAVAAHDSLDAVPGVGAALSPARSSS